MISGIVQQYWVDIVAWHGREGMWIDAAPAARLAKVFLIGDDGGFRANGVS